MSQQRVISTVDLPPNERVEFWHDSVRRHFATLDIGVHQDEISKGFRSTMVHASLGQLDLIQLDACKHGVKRDYRKIIADSNRKDYFIFSLQQCGVGMVEQEGRKTVIQPGEAVILDTSRPYSFDHNSDFNKCVVRIPAHLMKKHFSRPDRLCAVKIPHNTVSLRLLSTYLRGLADDYNALPATTTDSFSNALIEMLSGTLRELPECKMANDSTLKNYHLEEIKRTIANELANPNLGAEFLAERMGLSISSIYRVFASESTSLIQHIWNSRLEQCNNELLSETYAKLSITEIAFKWGFNSSAHFSRAFKSLYGVTPSARRKQHDALDHF